MSDKNLPPSNKRLTKARKDGKVPKSRVVSAAATWAALGLAFIPWLAWVRNGSLVQWIEYRVFTPYDAITFALWFVSAMSLTLVGVLAAGGSIAVLAQTKLLFCPSQLARGFEQYRPGAFLERARGNALDACLGLLRCIFLALVVAPSLCELVTAAPVIFHRDRATGLEILLSRVWCLYLRGTVALVSIAGVAYVLARWRFYRKLRMSFQEIKDEYKEDEGDPHAKAQRKHDHRAMLFSEIEKRVRRSKVVVVRRRPVKGS